MSTAAASDLASQSDRAFFGHPRGLSTLFFTEMWERFSYYGMRALLILFMTAAPAAGGLGFDAVTAGAIYGLYTSMVYMMTLPGGWIADRLIGPQRAVIVGGVLIASGHFSMAVPSLTTFYLGLALIVIGTGLLKGNVSVIVGRLYGPNDGRRDAGYSIFYMGINTGAFVAPLVCGYLGQRVSWHIGFAAAGVGMVVGLIQYSLGRKYLGSAGLHPADPGSVEGLAEQKRQAARWLGLGMTALVLVGIGIYTGVLPITATQIADAAGYVLLALSVGFFGWVFLSGGWTRVERNHLILIGVLFVGYALFASSFEQAGLHAEPVRRPQHEQLDLRLEFSEQLVPIGERALRHRLRADVRLDLDQDGRARKRARSAVQVRHRAAAGWRRICRAHPSGLRGRRRHARRTRLADPHLSTAHLG